MQSLGAVFLQKLPFKLVIYVAGTALKTLYGVRGPAGCLIKSHGMARGVTPQHFYRLSGRRLLPCKCFENDGTIRGSG